MAVRLSKQLKSKCKLCYCLFHQFSLNYQCLKHSGFVGEASHSIVTFKCHVSGSVPNRNGFGSIIESPHARKGQFWDFHFQVLFFPYDCLGLC